MKWKPSAEWRERCLSLYFSDGPLHLLFIYFSHKTLLHLGISWGWFWRRITSKHAGFVVYMTFLATKDVFPGENQCNSTAHYRVWKGTQEERLAVSYLINLHFLSGFPWWLLFVVIGKAHHKYLNKTCLPTSTVPHHCVSL